MTTFRVVVGNIGTVYSGESRKEADKVFDVYFLQSKAEIGRAGGEDVTIMDDDGNVYKEYIGSLNRDQR